MTYTLLWGKGIVRIKKYFFVYTPEDDTDEKIVSVSNGYKDSSKDHYYCPMGMTEETSCLLRRQRACVCQPCLRLVEGCTLTPNNADLKAGTTPRTTHVKEYSARATPAACHTRNARNPLPEFCNGLSVRDNIIVRVHNDERANNPDEEHFVAKIEKKARKLDEGGVYSAVKYNKGDWILSARWYGIVASKTNAAGDRFYPEGFAQWIPCNSIIRGLDQAITL